MLAALLMGLAAIRYAGKGDAVGAVIATVAVMLAIVAAMAAGSVAHRGNDAT